MTSVSHPRPKTQSRAVEQSQVVECLVEMRVSALNALNTEHFDISMTRGSHAPRGDRLPRGDSIDGPSPSQRALEQGPHLPSQMCVHALVRVHIARCIVIPCRPSSTDRSISLAQTLRQMPSLACRLVCSSMGYDFKYRPRSSSLRYLERGKEGRREKQRRDDDEATPC